MNWSKNDSGTGSRGYHHGNLREALIDAALALIAEKGPGGFTITEAARAAGVSAAAPYRHFRDRDELLAEVASRGFERFESALARAWNSGRPNPFVALDNLGKAYMAFARNEPAFYTAMFEAGVPIHTHAALSGASERAFGVLRMASEALSAKVEKGQRPPPLMMALHFWSLAHGIAALFGRRDGGRRKLPMTPEELLEAGMLVYLQGLGLVAPADSLS